VIVPDPIVTVSGAVGAAPFRLYASLYVGTRMHVLESLTDTDVRHLCQKVR
jgi:hypothetical protein